MIQHVYRVFKEHIFISSEIAHCGALLPRNAPQEKFYVVYCTVTGKLKKKKINERKINLILRKFFEIFSVW